MSKGFARFAGLAFAVAATAVAIVELPIAGRAAAGTPAPIVEARLPEALPLRPGVDLERKGERRPADACADQAWPYIGPDCASRDDGRPLRKVRLITSADNVTVSDRDMAAPAALPARAQAEPAKARPLKAARAKGAVKAPTKVAANPAAIR